ncbi:hypothetical protein HYC85_007154 [Camellia sinensis]|uniref:Uncharacterized protein n=1 Tax=Camellia sinensis TaxID=4442 RepID=A0A7J7HQL3_CAMSI|nr:hypothetical protein HYC85_007154 [Camellia sinensis]
MADRQQRMPTSNIYCRRHKITGRWTRAMAGDVWGCLTRHSLPPPRKNTSVWCKTRHNTVESRDPEVRRATETSGNSRRTQTRLYRDINLVNNKGFHMTITNCNNFVVECLNITHLKIARIHMASILAILIKLVYLTPSLESVMTTFLLVNVNISGITCGPGHDIKHVLELLSFASIDRLGKKPKENRFCIQLFLDNITNGVRIKTFHNSPKIQASNITFEDITIKDVQNPIIIDQHYRSKNTTN